MADKEHIDRILQGLGEGDEAALEQEFRDLYPQEKQGFDDGFADRVMARTELVGAPGVNKNGSSPEAEEKGMDYFLPRLFRWVAVAGVAAAVVLMAVTYFAEDDLSIDAFSGINQVSVEEVASLNF